MLCIEERLQLYCFYVVEKCWILRYTFLMSNSMVLCDNFLFSHGNAYKSSLYVHNSSTRLVQISFGRRNFCGFLPKAKKRHSKKKKSWWRKFFFEDEGNWFGLKDEDMVIDDDEEDLETESVSGDDELTEDEKFEAWKQRAEAIVELREAQEGIRYEENKMWEDWIVDDRVDGVTGSSWVGDSNGDVRKPGDDVKEDPVDIISQRGLVKKVRNMFLGKEEDEILYEDRVFRYASVNSAKFLAVLVLVPWAVDFLVHDYVLMPFLDRYVKTVPFAAQLLDVRRSQKLEIVKEINLVKSRYRLEVEIGKSPPLSDEQVWEELHNKALELREERRLENRRAFANIWSDVVYGVTLFILLYFNQSEVALLKFTGYKLLNNLSDTGKAFTIILVTDIFLGYHSESGWQTLCEVILEHYGIEVDEAVVTIFISLFPVIVDACVKLWIFKYLPRLSPRVSTIFKEMTRH